MNEDRLNELLERCDSPIECQLLKKLYPRLSTNQAHELCAQHKIDYYNDMPLTIPDFAFPKWKIAVYCDGFVWRIGNRDLFVKDRFQSRELQLRGWIVLRFAGREINYESETVVKTIQRAIFQWEKERTSLQTPQQRPLDLQLHSSTQSRQKPQSQQKPEGGICGVVFLACVIVGILVLLDFIF